MEMDKVSCDSFSWIGKAFIQFAFIVFLMLTGRAFADFDTETSPLGGQLLTGIGGLNWVSHETPPAPSSQSPSSKRNRLPPLLELKAGYFFFYDSKMSKVYKEGGYDIQLCGSTPLWKWLQIYASAEFLEKEGKSLNGDQKTRIWEVPLSLGLEAAATINKKVQYYFTVGPRYFFVHVHNSSHYVNKRLNEDGLGGFLGTGFHFFPYRHLVIDLFGEFSYCRLHFHSHKENVHARSVQVGGFVFGGGIGYAF